jgi:hypothetical protein
VHDAGANTSTSDGVNTEAGGVIVEDTEGPHCPGVVRPASWYFGDPGVDARRPARARCAAFL